MVNLFLWAVLFCALVSTGGCSTCTDPNASSLTLSTYEYEDTGHTLKTMMLYIKEGPVSGQFYSFGMVEGAANNTLIRKTDDANVLTWAKIYSTQPSPQFFLVDSLETYLYFLENGSTSISCVEVDASTGSVHSVKISTDLQLSGNKFRPSQLPNSAGFAFTAQSTSEAAQLGCRWLGGTSPLDCFKFDQTVYGYSILAISSDQFYSTLQGTDNNLHYMLADFSNPSVFSWSKYSACVGACSTLSAGSAFSADTNEIYTLYNINNVLLFFGLNATDGSLVDDQYTSSSGCLHFYDISHHSGKIYTSGYCNIVVIAVYDISSRTFSYYQPPTNIGVYLRGMTAKGDFLYIIGDDNTTAAHFGLKIKTLIAAPEASSDITTHYYTFSSFTTGPNELLSETVNATSFVTKPTFADATTVSDSASANNELPGSTTDVAFYVEDISVTGLEAETSYTQTITPTCSVSGSTFLTYSLSSYNDTSVLTWVSISGTDMTVDTPAVQTQTTYAVNLETYNGATLVSTQTYFFTVNPKPSSSTDESSVKDEIAKETVADASKTISAVITAGIVIVSILNSSLNNGSPQGLWSVINQFQFYILLPLVFKGLPSQILTFLAGLDFALTNFEFIPTEKMPGIKQVSEYFECDSTDEYFESLGVERSCTFINFVTAYFIIFCVSLIHLVVIVLYCFSEQKKKTKWSKFIKKVFKAFTFTFYIRYLIEGYLILSLTSLFEIKSFDFETQEKSISFAVSAFILACCLLTLFLAFKLAQKAARFEMDEENSYLSEFINGTKESLPGRLTIFFHLLRVALSVLCVGVTQNFSNVVKGSIFISLQLIFTLLKSVFRPFEEVQSNIIEILNDWTYLSVCCFFLVRDITQNTTTFKEDYFILTMMLNSCVILIIQLIFLISALVKWCRDRKKAKMVKDSDVTQDQIHDKTSRQLDSQNIQAHRMRKVDGHYVIDDNRDYMKTIYRNNIDVSQNDVSVQDIGPSL